MPPDDPAFLTAAEVADLFRVDPRTVTSWVRRGVLSAVRTPGGGDRGRLLFRREDVEALLTPAWFANGEAS